MRALFSRIILWIERASEVGIAVIGLAVAGACLLLAAGAIAFVATLSRNGSGG